MMELVYISDLKSEFSEFESRYPHHTAFVQRIGQHSSKVRMWVRFLHAVPELCRWSQLDRHWIANPWKQVRFLSPTPVILKYYLQIVRLLK